MLQIKTLRIIYIHSLIMIGAVFLFPLTAIAEELWTLESSVKQVVKTSPGIFAADAEIDAQKGALSQAGAWPNPEIGITGSEQMGLDDGTGGKDLTQFSISQPIPLGRLSRQKKYAEANLVTAKHERLYRQLLQENMAARYFHALQLTEAKSGLAKEKLKFAGRYQKGKNSQDPLVRYLSKLDKKRLGLIREVASQDVASTEGEYSEALSNFREFLKLPQDASHKTIALKPTHPPEALDRLIELQKGNHAAIAAAKSGVKAADAAISLARGERFPDLNLTLSRERDVLNGRRQNFNALMLNFTVPIWDLKNGNIAKAKAQTVKAKYELQTLERDLQASLKQSYLHLGHLIEQGEHYRTRILGPAKEVFTLTQKSFASDEVKILSLIDASNTYFDARTNYLELLHESWVEAADLRLASGLTLQTDDADENSEGEK